MIYYLNRRNITLQFVVLKVTPRRFLLKNNKELEKLIERQTPYEDLFITKYANNGIISTIILDFDGEDDKDKVYKEVLTIHNFLKYKGVNSVIVSSTNKGYHFYIQIPQVYFNDASLNIPRSARNKLFVLFTKNLINQQYFKFKSLDETNTHAGLGGNIRLIGSKHPKTNKIVDVVLGQFLNLDDEIIRENYYDKCLHYVTTIYNSTLRQYRLRERIEEQKIIHNRKNKKLNKNWSDPIEENDLRQLLPQLYGGKVNDYGRYIFMQCPWHTDRHPSCKVTKEWFYCTGCGKKGNIWTLIKSGEIRL